MSGFKPTILELLRPKPILYRLSYHKLLLHNFNNFNNFWKFVKYRNRACWKDNNITSSCSDSETRFPVLNFQTPSTFPVTLKAQQEPQAPVSKIISWYNFNIVVSIEFLSICFQRLKEDNDWNNQSRTPINDDCVFCKLKIKWNIFVLFHCVPLWQCSSTH